MNAATDDHVVYVSATEGNDDWTGRLAAPAADGSDGPLATLPAAVAAARDMARSPERPATVVLADGRHRLDAPLPLGPDASHITFRAADGARPVIATCVPVTGWQPATVNDGVACWKADVADVIDRIGDFRQLFVNGRRAQPARLPKEGVYWMADVPGTTLTPILERKVEQRHTFIAGEGHWQEFRNITDCNVVMLHWWIEERCPVASYDPHTRSVTLAEEPNRPLVDDLNAQYARYYIEHVFEALTAPGDWYLDREAQCAYYVPQDGETPETADVVAPAPDALLNIHGDPDAEALVENVRFEGIAFEGHDWRQYNRAAQSAAKMPGAIELRGAREIAFEDCAIRHAGNYAFDIQDGCAFCRIVGCEISDIGAGGIKVDGANAKGPRRRRTGNNIISDNHIHALGRVHHCGPAITLKNTFGNYVAHNHIHDLYYTGISVGWVWGYAESVARDNRIEKNHIHDVGQGWLNDMGAVYLLGVQPGTAVRGNVIHDVHSHRYGGWAIYPDEGSSEIVIENNLCYDCTSQLFHLHFGRESHVRNNLWAFAGEAIIAISRGNDTEYTGSAPDGRITNAFTFERNIVITDGSPIFLGGMERWIGDVTGTLDRDNFISDLNCFWDVGGAELWCADGGHLIADEGYDRVYPWDEWTQRGNDRHSVIADPKCADIAGRDFTLADDSPALELGFKPLDVSDVGPRPKDKRTFPLAPLSS
ncbi:MAG: right-handed parallel beta-helix repeat-containing protein [Phycisphaerae bacterium]|nr:right-handed parallel beta-helix repeat-containing protein [Phycisphaerae bacterium]